MRAHPLTQCSRALRFLIAVVLLCYAVTAQQVRLANYGTSTYQGWFRRTIDVAPPSESGTVDGMRYVLGHRVGITCRVIDIWARLEPGSYRMVDLARATAAPPPAVTLPSDPAAWFGFPTFAGAPLTVKEALVDGAALRARLGGRVGRMFWVDLWTTYYPGQAWVAAELQVTCSNPAVPDMGEDTPAGFRLTWGDAEVLVPGLPRAAPFLEAGEHFADGQARAWPLTIAWPRHFQAATDYGSVGVAWQFGIGCVARQSIGELGTAQIPAGFDPTVWFRANWPSCLGTLHSWQPATLGVAARSGDTGAQEDQGYCKGNEALHPRGAGAELPTYFAALGQVRRPCHHLNADGSLLVLADHPELWFWDSRPHRGNRGEPISPDQLGKPRALDSMNEAHGWSGPDAEHNCRRRLRAALELFGSPLLQRELEHAARIYLLQDTVDPARPTSHAWGERAGVYAGQLVVECWQLLEDRALANQVAERWRQRVLQVYIPQWGGKPLGVWYPRDDARVLTSIGGGYTAGWMPYQHAVGLWGMWLASSIVGPPQGIELVRTGALALVNEGYSQVGATWVEWDMVGYTGQHLPATAYVEGNGAHRTGWFQEDWFRLGIAAALRVAPDNVRARAIWAQMDANAADATRPLDWRPPMPGAQ